MLANGQVLLVKKLMLNKTQWWCGTVGARIELGWFLLIWEVQTARPIFRYGSTCEVRRRADFLSDRRVVQLNPLVWRPLLHSCILPFRSGLSAQKYKRIWTDHGSPLVVTTHLQADRLQRELFQRFGNFILSKNPSAPVDSLPEPPANYTGLPLVEVAYGMRYGQPSVQKALDHLHERGIRKLLVLPLYAQPAEPSVASAYDAVFNTLRTWKFMPDLRMVGGFTDHPAYITALSKSVKNFWAENGKGQKLLISYHGIPSSSLKQGDPYYCHCSKTTRLLAESLQLKSDEYEMTFQSRFGWSEWLQPYLDERLKDLKDFTTLDIITPGFISDCLETINEVGREYEERFHKTLTGEKGKLRRIPCLNASTASIEMLAVLVEENLAGWLLPTK